MKCEGCTRDFPPDLLHVVTVSAVRLDGPGAKYTQTVAEVCPLCARKLVNKQHDLPEDTPFTGRRAAALYKRAVAHLTTTGQPV